MGHTAHKRNSLHSAGRVDCHEPIVTLCAGVYCLSSWPAVKKKVTIGADIKKRQAEENVVNRPMVCRFFLLYFMTADCWADFLFFLSCLSALKPAAQSLPLVNSHSVPI